MVTSVLKGAAREAALQRPWLAALEFPGWGLQLPQVCRI